MKRLLLVSLVLYACFVTWASATDSGQAWSTGTVSCLLQSVEGTNP